jgi:hypothetical protein
LWRAPWMSMKSLAMAGKEVGRLLETLVRLALPSGRGSG